MGKCNTDPSREYFTRGIISFLPVPLHFLLQSILVLSRLTTEKCFTERKKERKERKFSVLKHCTHVVCSIQYEWLVELIVEDNVQRVDHVICLNQWLHASESNVIIFQVCVGGGRCCKCRCDFSSKTTLWCCCRRWATPNPPLLLSPLSSAHYSPQQPDKLKQHRFSLSPSALVWSEPVLSCLVQSSPIQLSHI